MQFYVFSMCAFVKANAELSQFETGSQIQYSLSIYLCYIYTTYSDSENVTAYIALTSTIYLSFFRPNLDYIYIYIEGVVSNVCAYMNML